MGFADSKQLTEAQREMLFKKIKRADDYLGWIVSILSPSDISTSMLGRVCLTPSPPPRPAAHRRSVVAGYCRVLASRCQCKPRIC